MTSQTGSPEIEATGQVMCIVHSTRMQDVGQGFIYQRDAQGLGRYAVTAIGENGDN